MRKTTAVATALGLTALALVGCSASPQTAESCGRVAVTDDALNAVSVSGEFGSQPRVDAPAAFHTADAEHADVRSGDGPVISTLNQGAVIEVVIADPASGSEVAVTGYTGELSSVLGLANVVSQLPGLEGAFLCASEGSRVVASLGEGGVTDSFGQNLQAAFAQVAGVTDGVDVDSLIAVVDVLRVVPAAADGDPVYNAGFGMPSVVRDPDGVPGITVPVATPPTEQVTQTLLKGDGAEIAESDALTLQYTSVGWNSGSVTNSTWQSGAPETTLMSELPAGFAAALEGATVGSQILTVVPGEGGDATVSVIDVLGAVPAPTAAPAS